MAKVNDRQGKRQSKGNRGCDSRDGAPKPERFPQRFKLYGKTTDDKRTFSMGAHVVQSKARAEVELQDVVEDRILYHTGLRNGDILKSVNDIPVKKVDLQDLVDMISELNAFYFVLRRRSLQREHYSYIHINFNAETERSDSPEFDKHNNNDEKGQVTTKSIATYFGVTQEEDTYVPVEYPRPSYYRKLNETPRVLAKSYVDGGECFLNTDGTDSFVQFTTNEVTLTKHVYENGTASKSDPRTVIVLCPPTAKMCFHADKHKNLFVGKKGDLKQSYITLDERFFIEEAIDEKFVRLGSFENPDYYVTAATINAHTIRSVMSPTGSHIEFLPDD